MYNLYMWMKMAACICDVYNFVLQQFMLSE